MTAEERELLIFLARVIMGHSLHGEEIGRLLHAVLAENRGLPDRDQVGGTAE